MIAKYGEITYDEEGKILCHICNKSFERPLYHARQVHNISAREYKKEFGLDLTKGITSVKSHDRSSVAVKKYYDLVVVENLHVKGKETRYVKGHIGRTKEQVSEQTRRRLVTSIARLKKSKGGNE